MIDAGGKTGFPVFFDDGAGQAAHIFVADTAVVWALWNRRIAVFRPADRSALLIEEIFLLQADPQVRVVLNGGAHIGGMRGAIRVHDFA